ncbi:potassium/proton antiporter [Pseudalkalibacillus hwajinpoensis]|uniref:potassium/proton antiporter n=1 Tax=Guptibacillus hwajinpoensis TaxID=208199 RepID=UPI00325BCC36
METNTVILFSALFLIGGVVMAKFSSRLGVPALVLFIIVGMLFGSDGFGFIYFDNASLTQSLGILALVLILFDGGLQTEWKKMKTVLPVSLSLATFGVLITTGLFGVVAKMLLDVNWNEALLLGAIVGSTDAAAVFAVLKGKNIKRKLESTLEAESGSNDPMAMFLTLSLLQLAIGAETFGASMFLTFFWQMGAGLLLGIIFGYAASWAMKSIELGSSGLYPVFSIAIALITFSISDLVNASGLLAVYAAALVLGNTKSLPYGQTIFRFHDGIAWMMQILMFIMLGLLVFPSELFSTWIVLKGLALSLFLILIARPFAVLISTIPFKFTIKEKVFLSWAGLRGAVPIVLATFPLLEGLENSQLFFNLIFFIVLTSALFQGATIPYLAKRLSLTGPEVHIPSHSLELVSSTTVNAEMIPYAITSSSKLLGKELSDISFPDKVLVSAIIRKDQLIAPSGDTKIKVNDVLYILVENQKKSELEKVLGIRKTIGG